MPSIRDASFNEIKEKLSDYEWIPIGYWEYDEFKFVKYFKRSGGKMTRWAVRVSFYDNGKFSFDIVYRKGALEIYWCKRVINSIIDVIKEVSEYGWIPDICIEKEIYTSNL